MPIPVTCSCGKRTTVGDPLAGKTIRCPGCGDELYIPAASPSAAKTAAKKNPSPGVHISPGLLTLLVCGGAGVILAILFVAGPLRVWHQWDAKSGKATDDVTDVVTFALQCYLSENGGYNPKSHRGAPSVDSVQLYRPLWVLSMPDAVEFTGLSSQGAFKGKYHPTSGEVDADVEIGGKTLAGIYDVKKGTSSIHISGRETNHQPQAEINGRKLKLIYPATVEE